MNIHAKKIAAARLSIVSNSVLMIMKLITGVAIGSVSIISEAIHSAIDLLAAIIAFVAVHISGRPADENHPFGHGKIENISGTIEALLILIASGWIIYESVHKLFHPKPIFYLVWGVGIMLLSAITNVVVSHILFETGEETDSIALQADAWHLRTDVYTSAGVMIALAIIWAGGHLMPDVPLLWMDPVAAMIVAAVIIHAGIKLTVRSARDLMDTTLPAEEEQLIRTLIAHQYPRVHGFHRLRTRKAGSDRFIEFNMMVDPQMSVEDSHRITEELNDRIAEQLARTSVTIHVEPCDGRCDNHCQENCLLSEEERKTIKHSYRHKTRLYPGKT